MKLLETFKQQITKLGQPKRVWMSSFNLSLEFIEGHLLPAILEMDPPRSRMDYESFQVELVQRDIDVRIFCDKRMLQADQLKRTAIAVHPVSPRSLVEAEGMTETSLFHPKVIYLENAEGDMVLGAGSANLTVGGWGRNQEVFAFREVTNNTQYQQIKSFFGALSKHLDLELDLPVKRKFSGNDPHWKFVHSFQTQSFLQQLLMQPCVERLSVWSPYLASDVPALLDKLRGISGNDAMTVALVADKLEERCFRTPWSEALQSCLSNNDLAFFDNPSERHESTEMTHAKVWLAHSADTAQLAIGSWNFTPAGTSSLATRNIEAGIVLTCPAETEIVGRKVLVGEADFASLAMLEDDALALTDEPPFDIQVCFDWQAGMFRVTGQWHVGQPTQGLLVNLPGLDKRELLSWKTQRVRSGQQHALVPIELSILDNEVLLTDRTFTVYKGVELKYHGIVLEDKQAYRRALGFDSLKDLIDSLVAEVDVATHTTLVLRTPHGEKDDLDEGSVLPDAQAKPEALSYFRLFEGMEQFRERLRKVESRDVLERWLFTYPGCVQELVTKVQQRIAEQPPTVFSWFLAQEVNSLMPLALEKLEQFRERYERRTVPERWNVLTIREPKLPSDLTLPKRYLGKVRKEAGYAVQ